MQFLYGDETVPSLQEKGQFFLRLKCIYTGNVYGKAGVSRKVIEKLTGIPAKIARDPVSIVATGLGHLLK